MDVSEDKGRRFWPALLVATFVILSMALTLGGHATFNVSRGFSHSMYIPSILAALWWRRRGMVVGLTLAAFLLVSHAALMPQKSYLLDGIRAAMVVSVSVTVALLSERIEATRQALAQKTIRLRQLGHLMSTAQDRQRREIAQGLHDLLTQDLVAVKINVGLIGRASNGTTHGITRDTLELVEKLITATRDLTFDIYPPMLHELGLRPALEWEAERIFASSTISWEVDRWEIPAMGLESRNWLFRALRELLLNTKKHARASRVELGAALEGPWLEFWVRDDGVGFPDGGLLLRTDRVDLATAQRGFGLFSIQERVSSLGGVMEIQSDPNGGTLVRLQLPESVLAEEEKTCERSMCS